MRKNWGAPQWSAFMRDKDIPVMPRTVEALGAMVTERGMDLVPRDIADIALDDPFFALRLLRKAEMKRSHSSLGMETTTLLTSVMHLGTRYIISDTLTAPKCPSSEGLERCERRAALGAHIAKSWASFRADLSPDEIAMAALLSDLGELMLWLFAPDLPSAALDELFSGRAKRSREAQLNTCGFGFKDLSIKLAEDWNLPLPVKQLMGLADTNRARLAKCAVEAARHICTNNGLVAIPDDLRAVHAICPTAKYTELLKPLHLVPEHEAYIIELLAEGT